MSDETTPEDVLGAESEDALEASEEVTEVTDEIEAEAPEPTPEPTPEPESAVTEAPAALEAPAQENDDEAAKRAALDRKLTRENQALRKRAKEAEAKVKEYEEASLSEKERQERRLQELVEQNRQYETRLRESSLSLAVSAEAARLNIVDPDAAVKLLDSSSIEWDNDTNSWQGVDEAMAALVEDRPYLVRPEQKATPTPKDAPANPSRRRTRLTREALSKMSQAEIDALPWEDVQAALASD